MKLTVNLKENSYPIYIENGILNRAGEYIADLFHGQRIMIVSDDNVFPLYGNNYAIPFLATSVILSSSLMENRQKVSTHFRKSTPQCLTQN